MKMALSMANITKAGSTLGSNVLSGSLTLTEKSSAGPRDMGFTTTLDSTFLGILALGIRLG
jgi:hypothetical protein